jgi:hypothetical protein
MELHSATARAATPTDRYVDVREAASILGLSIHYLNKLRLVGGGPPFSSFGRAVRYSVADLIFWAASKRSTSTSTR